MTTATFNRQLDERGLPRQFANINLASFTCPELCKVIKLFDEFARGLSDQRKIQLAARLIQLKPRPLRPAERRAVEHLWSKRLTVEQARGLLPTHRHRSTAKHRQQSNSSHGQQVTTSKAQVRPSIQLPEHNATYSSSNTSSTSQILSAIGYYPSATHYVRNPNDWLSGTTKPAIRTCETCMEDLLIIRFPVTLQGAHCQHKEAIICTECLSVYIEAQATSSPLNEIRCPEPNCNSTLDYDHMKKYAPSHLFTRYDSYLNSKALENIEDCIECSNKTCHFGGMLDVSITTYMTCPDCDTRTCTTCRTPWHPEMSHEENMAGIRRAAEEEEERVREEARKVNEEFESNKTVKVKTKACPSKKCGVRIQKNGGCDHMTCQSCKHEFCWCCLADYGPIRRSGNHYHDKKCKHYRELPRPHPAPVAVARRRPRPQVQVPRPAVVQTQRATIQFIAPASGRMEMLRQHLREAAEEAEGQPPAIPVSAQTPRSPTPPYHPRTPPLNPFILRIPSLAAAGTGQRQTPTSATRSMMNPFMTDSWIRNERADWDEVTRLANDDAPVGKAAARRARARDDFERAVTPSL